MASYSARGSERCWRTSVSRPICRPQWALTPSSSAPPLKARPFSGSAQVRNGTIALRAGGPSTADDHWVKPKYEVPFLDRKSTRLNYSHQIISYAVFSFNKKNHKNHHTTI